MRTIRILWICAHRTHRYEEVSMFLKAGAEVVPVKTQVFEYPNAVEEEEGLDNLYPNWRQSNTIPDEVLTHIREINYFADYARLTDKEKKIINEWIDVVIVASFSEIAASFLDWFSGYVILRAFGGYAYSGVFKPMTVKGHRLLNKISRSANYYWSPNIPYLTELEDPRITRNEMIIPPCVSPDRFSEKWVALESKPYICEVISLIEKHRWSAYQDYKTTFAELPLKILGQNDKSGALADDPIVVGTLSDKDYYSYLVTSRAMVYLGLRSKYHIHYHVLEALMIGLPVIFFSDGSVANIARFYGISNDYLTQSGMSETNIDAINISKKCLADINFAIELSEKQEALRELFSPTKAYRQIEEMVSNVRYKVNFKEQYAPTKKIKYTGKTMYRLLRFITG